MAVTVPLLSVLNETPSSTGESGPLSTVAGTIVLGQMVCWAVAFEEQANPTARPKSAVTACFKNFNLDVLAAVSFPLSVYKERSAIPMCPHWIDLAVCCLSL